jgi:hypothetical protein
VALDEGQVRAGRLSASISELELELKRGKAGDVFKVARELAKLVPAKLELKSKGESGYDLIEHKPIQAVCAEKASPAICLSGRAGRRLHGTAIRLHPEAVGDFNLPEDVRLGELVLLALRRLGLIRAEDVRAALALGKSFIASMEVLEFGNKQPFLRLFLFI